MPGGPVASRGLRKVSRTVIRRCVGLGWLGLLIFACVILACGEAGQSPDDPALLDRWRGENAVAEGRYDWARQYFALDVQRHPDHLPSLRQEGLSWLSGYQQSLSAGAELLARYLELHGEDEVIEQRLVQVLLMLGEDEALDRWVETLDDSASAQRLRAEVYLRSHPERAVQAIESALVQAPGDAAVQGAASRIFEHLEDGPRVQEHALRALELDPFDFRAAYLLGRWTQRLGERQDARRWLELHQGLRRLQHDGTMAPLPPKDALQLMDSLEDQLPALPFSWHKRQLELHFERRDLAAAQSLLDDVVDSPEATLDDWVEVATWAGDAGRRGSAEALFERVLKEEPDHAGALASLALLSLEQGDLRRAGELLTHGLQTRPHMARLHFLAGRVAVQQDQAENARQHLETAVRLAPWEWPWRIALCDLLLALGDRAAFTQALEGAPEESPGWLAYRRQHS